MTEKEAPLMPAPARVRQETLRSMLQGMKRMIENGCVIKSVTVIMANPAADAAKRSRRLGKHRDRPAVTKQAPGKPGRPEKRRRRKGETAAQKKTRLATERQQRKRARDRKEKKGPKT